MSAYHQCGLACLDGCTETRSPPQWARAEMVLRIVPEIAGAIWKKLPPSIRSIGAITKGVDVNDLIGAGYLGLLKAAGEYAPADHGGAPFGAYARTIIQGAVRDQLKRELRWFDRSEDEVEGDALFDVSRIHQHRHDLNVLLSRMDPDEAFAVSARLAGEEYAAIGLKLGISGTGACQKIWRAVGLDPKDWAPASGKG